MSGGVLTLSMTLIFVTVPPDVHTCSEDAEHPSSRRRPTLLGGGGAGWEGGGRGLDEVGGWGSQCGVSFLSILKSWKICVLVILAT